MTGILALVGFITVPFTLGTVTGWTLTHLNRRRTVNTTFDINPIDDTSMRPGEYLTLSVGADESFSLRSVGDDQRTVETLIRVLDEVMNMTATHRARVSIDKSGEVSA